MRVPICVVNHIYIYWKILLPSWKYQLMSFENKNKRKLENVKGKNGKMWKEKEESGSSKGIKLYSKGADNKGQKCPWVKQAYHGRGEMGGGGVIFFNDILRSLKKCEFLFFCAKIISFYSINLIWRKSQLAEVSHRVIYVEILIRLLPRLGKQSIKN